MTDLGGALRTVVGVLEGGGIPYMVIGGLANLVWGEPRTTTDLDITVEARDTARFLTVAARCGELLGDDPREVAERGRLVPVRTDQGVRVDFALATLSFETEAIERARRIALLGVDVRVVTSEDLIVMKSVSERARDHEDVIGIVRRQGETLDVGRLDRILEGLAADLAEPAIGERWREAKRRAAGGA